MIRTSPRAQTDATTAPVSRRALLARSGFLLVPPETLASPVSGLQYRADKLIGEGGYGQAYLATRLGRSRTVASTVASELELPLEPGLQVADTNLRGKLLLELRGGAHGDLDRLGALGPDGNAVVGADV